MEAFGTFKGGGVKGLAHVGAYAAAYQRGVKFVGVAGTSAGAIVAALIAVGYKPDDLYNAKNNPPIGPFAESYSQFFDRDKWQHAKDCGTGLTKVWQERYRGSNRAHVPLFFEPKVLDQMDLVDGGIVSNIPAWALDDERAKAGIQVPTIVFKLDEWKSENRTTTQGNQINHAMKQ